MKLTIKYKRCLFSFLMIFNSAIQAEDIEAHMSWAGLQRTGFTVTGIVESVSANVGAKVKPGDVLAQLDAAPFTYNLQYCKAVIDKLQPAIFDAKTELGMAKELLERTVLSEVELQKIEGVYKSFKAEELMAEAECKLKQWQAERAVLKAQTSAYVLSSNIYPGMVISAENTATVTMELVSATKASAVSLIGAQQARQYNVGDQLKVVVDGQEMAATIESITWQGSDMNQYKLSAEFYYVQKVVPGKPVTLRF
jgi:membrane fusion protein, multidrug efflux system